MGKIELKKPMFFEARTGYLSLQEKKMAGGFSRNINKIVKNSLPEHTFAKRQIEAVSMQVARRVVRAEKDSFKQLWYQGWLSSKELSALKRSVPFTPFNLIERLAGILLDCHYNKISFSNTLILVRKFMPLEYVIELKDKYDISFCDTMRFIRTYKEPEKVLNRGIPLAKRLARKYMISLSYAMYYVKEHGHENVEETLKNAVNFAKRLVGKYKVPFSDAFFFIMRHGYTKYTEAEEELNNAILLAERLSGKYKVSLSDAMYYVKAYGYGNVEVTLKNAINLAKILMKKYDTSFSDSLLFIKQYKEPEKALRGAVYLAKRLARKYKISYAFAIFHVERYGLKNVEEALKNNINSAKSLKKDYDISFCDAMKIIMKHKNPRAILNRKKTIELMLHKREDFPPLVYDTIIKASILKDNYLEVALNLSRKLDKLVDELKKIGIPREKKLSLPEAIAQLSLLHGSLLGTLLIQAFGGEAKIRKAERYDELKPFYHAQFNENFKYPGVEYPLTPLDILIQNEEMIENQQRAQRIRDLLMSALPEKGPERKIQTKILLWLLSGDLDLYKLTKELNITLEKVQKSYENFVLRVNSDPRIEKELRDLDFFRD